MKTIILLLISSLLWSCKTRIDRIERQSSIDNSDISESQNSSDLGEQKGYLELKGQPGTADAFEIDPEILDDSEKEALIDQIFSEDQIIYMQFSVDELEPNSPLADFLDPGGVVTIAINPKNITFITAESKIYEAKDEDPLENLDLANTSNLVNILKEFKHTTNKFPDASYSNSDNITRKIIDAIATPATDDFDLYRFTPHDVASRQIQTGKISTADIDFYHNKRYPGVRPMQRAGRGLYALEIDKLHHVSNSMENNIVKNSGSFIKVTIRKDTKILDLTDPNVTKLLKKFNISYDDVAFVDPKVAIRFKEYPGKTFWVIKDYDNVSISATSRKDFDNLRNREPDKFARMYDLLAPDGREAIREYLPDNFVPLKVKNGFFQNNVLEPIITVYKRIAGKIAGIYYGRKISRSLRRTNDLLSKHKILNDISQISESILAPLDDSDFIFAFNKKISAQKIDEMHKKMKPSIVLFSDESVIQELKYDSRFRLTINTVKNPKNLPKDLPIPDGVNLQSLKIAFLQPKPLILKPANENDILKNPHRSNPIDTSMPRKSFDKYFNQPYKRQNRTISKTIAGRVVKVHRPNHSVLNGMRGAQLSIDATLLIAKHYKETPMGIWVNKQLSEDSGFLNKIYYSGLMMRAAREGEAADSDKTGLLFRSAAVLWNESEPSGLGEKVFGSAEERKTYARSLLYDHRLKNLHTDLKSVKGTETETLMEKTLEIDNRPKMTEEEGYIASLLFMGHFNDHRRANNWRRDESFEEQTSVLKHAGKIEDTNINSLIYTLWTRSGYYLKATHSADVDQFITIGTNWNKWRTLYGKIESSYENETSPLSLDSQYRHMANENGFFEMNTNPEKALEALQEANQAMSSQLLEKLPHDAGYLLPQ